MSLRDGHLDDLHHLIIRWVDGVQLAGVQLTLHLADPHVGLHLRIDHQGPTSTLGDQYTVLFAELVIG